MEQQAHEPSEARGGIMLLGAAFLFSLMAVQVKLAAKELPVEMLVLARGLITLVLSYSWLRVRGVPVWGGDKKLLVLRGVFGLGGLACFFYAVTVLPLAEVTVIFFLNPVFTALLAAVLLAERVGSRLFVAIAVALAGTLLVTRPGALFAGEALPLPGVVAAVVGALFSACAYVTVRKLRGENPNVIVFYFPLVAVPFTLPFALNAWVWPSLRGWLLMAGIGVTVQIAQVLLTRGLALVPAGRGTTVGYVQIVFAAAWGWLWFSERPGAITVVGALCIAGAVLLVLRRR